VWLWLTRNRSAFLWTGIAAVVGSVYFAWRYSFYGQLFPNTFYIKFGNITAGQAWLEATTVALLPLIVLTGALLLLRSTGSIGILFAATIAATWLPIALSGPTMDYVHRFAYHVYPVLCLGAGLALGLEVRRRIAAVVGALSVGWVALAGVTADDMPTVVNYSADLQRSHVSIAVSDAGAIPYYSGWNTIDYIGLNDEAIANGESPHVRVTDASPTVIVVTGRGPGPMENAYGLRVPEATEGYVRVADVLTRDNYSQHVFAKRQYAAEVRDALGPAIDEAVATHDPGRYDLTLDRWLDRLFGRL
jgi:arabinofuranosyltransferase